MAVGESPPRCPWKNHIEAQGSTNGRSAGVGGEPTPLGPHAPLRGLARLRANRKGIALIVGFVAAISILAALRLDVVRLGPASVMLPDDALLVSATWYRIRDGDSDNDYYMLLVHVQNRVDSDSILPYAVDVNVSAPGAEHILGWLPMYGDHSQMERVEHRELAAPQVISLELPAGFVSHNGGRDYHFVWNVRGERGLASQPIFREGADFLLDTVVFPQNGTMEAHVDVLLTWYHVNPFQAYPVASRGAETVCYYVPEPGSEGSAPYSPCG